MEPDNPDTIPDVEAGPAEAPQPPPDAGEAMAAIARLTAVIEQMQQATASPAQSGDSPSAELTRRIERLESWMASNRLP
jgi:hypothetical protein